MQSSGANRDPRVLRCPHCGAPLELQPYAPLTQCRYCGHTVKLAEPAPPVFPPAPRVPPPPKPASSNRALVPLLAGSVMVVALVAVGAFVAAQSSASAPAPPPPRVPPRSAPTAVPTPRAVPTSPAEELVKLYPLESLLGVKSGVDIDGSHALMHDLFPTVSAGTHGVDLSYEVPLSHPWFGQAQFIWKNEKAGQLMNVGPGRPRGSCASRTSERLASAS
jgi:hypothetical protein